MTTGWNRQRKKLSPTQNRIQNSIQNNFTNFVNRSNRDNYSDDSDDGAATLVVPISVADDYDSDSEGDAPTLKIDRVTNFPFSVVAFGY